MEATNQEPTFRPPRTVGDALALLAGRSTFLRSMVLAVYGWSESKLSPDYAAVYGVTTEAALALPWASLAHGLAVYVAAVYQGSEGLPPIAHPRACSDAFLDWVVKARAVAAERVRIGEAAKRNRPTAAQTKARKAARKLERQNRKAGRK